MKISKHLYALAIAGACSFSAYGQTTVIDYPAPTVTFDYPNTYWTNLGFTFTTGASADPISGIDVYGYGNAPGSGSLSVSLHLGSETGSLLGSDNLGFTTTGSFSDISLTGINNIGAVTLSPNTTYSLVFRLSASNFRIGADSDLVPSAYTTPTGWSVVDSKFNFNIVNTPNAWTSWFGGAVSITTSPASPVPEASGSVAGIGLAMAGLYQLRRRKAAGRVVES